jgi:hypothetical protein
MILVPQAAWIEAEKEATKKSELKATELAAKEARLNAQADALTSQQRVNSNHLAAVLCWVEILLKGRNCCAAKKTQLQAQLYGKH